MDDTKNAHPGSRSISRRRFVAHGGASLLAGAASLKLGTQAFAAATGTPLAPVRFAVLADLHLDIRGTNAMKMSAVSQDCLTSAVTAINLDGDIEFVLVVGDLLLDGELQNARATKRILDQLAVPYYVVAGNHDYIPADPRKHRKGFDYLSVDDFVDFFVGHGYDETRRRFYAHQITPGLRILGLDACLPLEPHKWGGLLPPEQLDWLDRQLSDHADALNIIFVHHNLVRWSADERRGGPVQWFCIDNDAEVRRLLARHAKAAPMVISGHRHIGLNFQSVEGVRYFVVPSLNSHPMRYSVFSVTHRSVSWETPWVSLDAAIHRQATHNLLGATPWRASHLVERSPSNDAAVLEFYENNRMLLGSVSL